MKTCRTKDYGWRGIRRRLGILGLWPHARLSRARRALACLAAVQGCSSIASGGLQLRSAVICSVRICHRSLPWWLGNLGSVDVALQELFGSAIKSTATASNLIGNVGMRVSISSFWVCRALWIAIPVEHSRAAVVAGAPTLTLYLGAMGYALRFAASRDESPRWHGSSCCGALRDIVLGFALTPFGGDPSGGTLFRSTCHCSFLPLKLLRRCESASGDGHGR